MINLTLDFNNFKDKKELYEYLSNTLKFPSYFSYNLDSLYDILLDIDYSLTIKIINKEKYETIYLTLKDSEKENENIKIIEGA